ncbi:hypothetical protein CYMTET_8976 [Cymbomonas tetramitiformis]|uniref:Uncharacterized protein n=1 Tax=Cymbomonas tetramitiformis TaxID=36881 RepID=A0AAE0GTR5_9CHLO|nr:hypothetical protein CYMTET_8976 [Cymbomonas tetramitiformis]
MYERRLRLPHVNDYRPGLKKGSDKQVAFDPDARRAVPHCYSAPRLGNRGVLYHAHTDCPLGGGRPGAHAFCCPAAEHGEKEMHALALCHVYQQAAGDGPEAFSQVCEVHGAPEVLHAGGFMVSVDLTMYGFAVGGLSLTTASTAGGAAGELSANAVGMLPAAAAGRGDDGRALVAHAEDAPEVVVTRVTTVLQDAGAAGSVCLREPCCFGTECDWGMPQGGADSPLQAAAVKVPGPAGPLYQHFCTEVAIGAMSVAEQAESESKDDEAAEVHAQLRQQVLQVFSAPSVPASTSGGVAGGD